MNYYLIECGKPNDRLRHYKNSRVANYTRDQLNAAAGFDKYMVLMDDQPVVTLSVKSNFHVDHLR